MIRQEEKTNQIFNGDCLTELDKVEDKSVQLVLIDPPYNIGKDEWDKFKRSNSKISEEFILNKINERLNAKNNGNYKLADQIRDELLEKGVVIEDQKDKTVWKFK